MLKLQKFNRPPSDQSLQLAQKARVQFFRRTEIGFQDLPNRDHLWSESEKWGSWLAAGATDLVLIGIGGSSLGPQFLADVAQSAIRVQVCDNVDPWLFEKIKSNIKSWETCRFLIISKSGTTLETLVATELFQHEFEKRKLSFFKNCVVITEPRANSLFDWATQNQIPLLEVPLDVGGRFSILSPVGMVLAKALGLSIEKIRRGAICGLKNTELIEKLTAMSLDSFERGEWITFLWCYSSSLRYFGMWFEQLWAESLAKQIDRKGQKAKRVSSPFSALGVCDQHSVFQQVMEGARDKWIVQIRVDSCELSGPELSEPQFSALSWLKAKKLGAVLAAEAEATAEAMIKNNLSVTSLHLQDLGPEAVGELLMTWQLVVACVGEALDIDAFNQPGVELGKRLAKEILQK